MPNIIDLKIIRETIIELGVPVNVLGYGYIVSALSKLIENKDSSITLKEVYANIIKITSNSRENIEMCIYNAVKKAKTDGKSDYKALFGENRPSNSIFLHTVKKKILDKELNNTLFNH